jgi:hypothetical protein
VTRRKSYLRKPSSEALAAWVTEKAPLSQKDMVLCSQIWQLLLNYRNKKEIKI